MANHSPAVKAIRSVDTSFMELQAVASRAILRGDASVMSDALQALRLPTPLPTLGAVSNGPRAALWLGPDETLFIDDSGADLIAALKGHIHHVHSLVDVSHRQNSLHLKHAKAALLLQTGCPLDIDKMAVGSCTRSQFDKSEIILWRVSTNHFRLEIWRSFSDYVSQLLTLAAEEWL